MRPTDLVLAVVLSAAPVAAEDDDRRARDTSAALRATPGWKLYAAECGTCHLAFPPELLPVRSWKKLLGGLADHFGQNAEIDAPTLTGLTRFLEQQGGADVGGVPLRITTLPSWRREHREIPTATFARKAIVSPANCAACHPGAELGDFDEEQVVIPK
jgi:hypothetical protein